MEPPQMGQQPRPPRRLVGLPSWLAAQVAAHAQRLVGEALAARGVRRHHFAVLAALEEQGASSQAALGRRLALDPSDLHAVLNHLQAEGLVVRVRDGQDRRRNLVELTADGARALVALTDEVQAAQDALLAPLTIREREQLTALMARLHEHHRGPGPVDR